MSKNTFLEKVKSGHPIQTRDGRPARFIAHVPDASNEAEMLVVLVRSRVQLRFDDGSWSVGMTSPKDIILDPKPKVKREGWVAVSGCYDKTGVRGTSFCYPTQKQAKRMQPNWRVIRLEWEEEQE